MRSWRTSNFKKLYNALPKEVQHQAEEAYRLWRQNPSHPGLYFKQVQARRVTYYSVRIGLHYRALARSEPDGAVWFWIGTHTEYDKMLG